MRYPSLPFETLKAVLDEDSYAKVLEFCKGYSITFPRTRIEKLSIAEDYKEMRAIGMKKALAVKKLSEEYGKTIKHIYRILKEEGL